MSEGTIGHAAISIGADASRFDVDAKRQVEKSGKGVGKRFTGVLGGAMKAGAVGVGGSVAAIIGTSLTKGFSRLKSIDEAKGKLIGLGHSGKTVQVIMDNALASVKGTAFSMGDAAGVAATAVAAGIAPGKDLTRTLKLMADTATISGASMTEVGAIFGKVAAGGKVTGEVIGQLQDRGVPAMAFLAKEMGKTVPEVQKLVSAGKIGFPQFQSAMEKGLGGAALASGKTFKGALANVGAAMGRIGAKILSGPFNALPALFGKATAALDALGPTAEKIGIAVGKGFEIAVSVIGKLVTALRPVFAIIKDVAQGFKIFFDALTGKSELNEFAGALKIANNVGVTLYEFFTGSLIPGIKRVMDVFQQGGFSAAVTAVQTELTAALPGIMAKLGEWAKAFLSWIGPMIIPLIAKLFEIRNAIILWLIDSLPAIIVKLGEWAGAFISWITPMIPGMLAQLMTFITALWTSISAAVPKIVATFTLWASAFIGWVQPLIPPLLAKLGALAGKIWGWIVAAAPPIMAKLAAWGRAFIEWVSPFIPPLLAKLQTLAGKVWVWLQAAVPPLVAKLLAWGKAFIEWVAPMIPPLLGKLGELLQRIGNWAVSTGLPLLKTKLLEWGAAFLNWIGPMIGPILLALLKLANDMSKWLIGTGLPALVKTMLELATAMIEGLLKRLGDKLSDVIGWFSRHPKEEILSALSGAGTWLLNVGRDIIDGVVQGIKNSGDVIGDALLAMIPGPLKRFAGKLGIKSPSKLFAKLAQWIPRGVAEGILKGSKSVDYAMERLSERLVKLGKPSDAKQVEAQTKKVLSPIARLIDKNNAKLAAAQEKTKLQLKDANDRVKTAIREGAASVKEAINAGQERIQGALDDYNSVVSSISDALIGTAVFATKSTEAAPVSFESVIAELSAAAGEAMAFDAVLRGLQAGGIDPELFRQISAAGASSLDAAQALLAAGPAGIAQANAVQATLSTAATSAATFAANVMKGGAVESARIWAADTEKTAQKLADVAVQSAEEFLEKLISKRDQVEGEFERWGVSLAQRLSEALATMIKNLPTPEAVKAAEKAAKAAAAKPKAKKKKKGYAGGTDDYLGGFGLVGEEGPELVRLPRHSQIFPADQTRALLSRLPIRPGTRSADVSQASVTTVSVAMTVSIDDLAKIGKLEEFLAMLDAARVTARQTQRSGRVSA